MSARKVKPLSPHDVNEVVKFQRYLDDLALTGPTEAFYRKYQDYMGLSDAELAKILSTTPDQAMIVRCSCGSDFKPVCPDCGIIPSAARASSDPPEQEYYGRCDKDPMLHRERKGIPPCVNWVPDLDEPVPFAKMTPSSQAGQPAPKCVGFAGGCDGDLPGEAHEKNCPAAPPAGQGRGDAS